MPEAYIVDAVRTPVGRRGGGLSQVHPADLGAHVIRALLDRTDLDPLVVAVLIRLARLAGTVADTLAECPDARVRRSTALLAARAHPIRAAFDD